MELRYKHYETMTPLEPASRGGRAGNSSLDVSVPATPEMWGLCRMAVSTVASKLEFDCEQVEDLRIAVDELCTLCAAGSGPSTRLKMAVQWDDAEVTVTCVASDLDGAGDDDDTELAPGLTPKDLSLRILEALSDEYDVTAIDERTRRGWFCKSK